MPRPSASLMAAIYHRLLLVFSDGVGLAPASADNPLATVATPALSALLGGPLVLESRGVRRGVALTALDATLGVPGLPQSATGQTSLFTGVNAAARLGRHVTGFVGAEQRQILERGNLFSEARRRGRAVTFANAYGPAWELRARRRESVTTVATAVAGVKRRGVEELGRGEALSWDIERDLFIQRTGAAVPRVSARQAGAHLARLAARHDLTVFETFLTDLAGHGRGGEPRQALERLDGLAAGLRAEAPAELTWLLTSDHGNLEDATTRLHTRNPVPLVAVGPLAGRFAELESILEVTPTILECLPDTPS